MYQQLLLLMRCKIINLPVLKFRTKRVKTSIDKEQMFPTVSNLNEFDAIPDEEYTSRIPKGM